MKGIIEGKYKFNNSIENLEDSTQKIFLFLWVSQYPYFCGDYTIALF